MTQTKSAACFGALVTLGAMVLGANAFAAEVALGPADIARDQAAVSVPVILELGRGEQVSGIQFNIAFDNGELRLDGIAAGPAATDAGKDIYSNALTPRESTAIIAGLNQGRIAGGIVAYCRFKIVARAVPGEVPVTLKQATLSDPYGAPVPVSIASARNVPSASGDRPPNIFPAAVVFCVVCLLIAGSVALVRGKRARRKKG